MPALSLRLPEDLDQRLEIEARIEQQPRSEVVRIAIVDYLTRRERERFMAELVAEARTAYADASIRKEAMDMAEESITASNEALAGAEKGTSALSLSADQTEKWWK